MILSLTKNVLELVLVLVLEFELVEEVEVPLDILNESEPAELVLGRANNMYLLSKIYGIYYNN